MLPRFLGAAVMLLAMQLPAEIPRVWLTHQSDDPNKVVVNWETAQPEPSILQYGESHGTCSAVSVEGLTTLHHVPIKLWQKDTPYLYHIGNSWINEIDVSRVKGSPSKELRVVVVGDLHANIKPLAAAILHDDPHLILTAGDNVPSLHEAGKEGTKIFSALIDSAPELFRSIPFMPILGNHDKEAHPRGPKPAAEPVYDIDAKDFHAFFPLPGNGWCWNFDFPGFDVRFIALDLEHISDFGTTWQTCHDFHPGSEQFEWFKKVMAESRQGFVFPINNEQNSSMRSQAKGEWGKMFRQGSALITGFGTFNERAEWEGLPCFNTHAHGHGTLYKDPKSEFLTPEGGYLLLTFQHGADSMTLQIKSQKGEVLDTRVIKKIAR